MYYRRLSYTLAEEFYLILWYHIIIIHSGLNSWADVPTFPKCLVSQFNVLLTWSSIFGSKFPTEVITECWFSSECIVLKCDFLDLMKSNDHDLFLQVVITNWFNVAWQLLGADLLVETAFEPVTKIGYLRYVCCTCRFFRLLSLFGVLFLFD